MKKYLSIMKATLLEQWQYLGNVFGGFFVYGVIIIMFLQLWQYLYGNGNHLIGGYTMNQMVWYVIITELIWFTCRTKALRRDLSSDIKSGRIAYILNKPYNYILYLLSRSIGELIPNFIAFSFFGIFIGYVLIGPIEGFSIIAIPFIIITMILSIAVLSLIYILISIVAFWVEENSPFFWIYEKMILILGITFPIEILPLWLEKIIKVSPIYVTVYPPAKMVVDYSFASFLQILFMQVLYIVGLIIVVSFIYKRGVKKVNVNGG